MESKEQVFHHSFGKLSLMFLGELFFVLFAYLLRNEKYFGVIVVIFVVSLLVFLLYVTSRVKISDEEITTRGLLGSKSLKWSEIGHVSMRGQSLRLHKRDDDITLSLDSQLEGYKEILDLLFKKRSDLFEWNENNVLSRSVLNNLFVIGFALMIILFSVFIFTAQDQGIIRVFAFVFMGLGLSVIISWFLSPQSIAMQNQTLIAKYQFKEVIYKASDINSITFERRRTRDGYIYFVQVNFKMGKPLKLPTFKQGSAFTYQILKKWHDRAISSGHSAFQ